MEMKKLFVLFVSTPAPCEPSSTEPSSGDDENDNVVSSWEVCEVLR